MSAAHDWRGDAFRRSARTPSDRNFGLTMAVVLVLYAAYSFAHGRRPVGLMLAAAVIGAIAVVRPRTLHLPNVLWTRLGALLERIVNPLVLGLVFALVITPLALVMRLAGRDPLRRRIDRDATSYWIAREDPPTSGSWPRQF